MVKFAGAMSSKFDNFVNFNMPPLWIGLTLDLKTITVCSFSFVYSVFDVTFLIFHHINAFIYQ